MAESRGSLSTSNGSSHVNGKMNGQTKSRRKVVEQRKSPFAWVFNVAARLATWAAILTILFRCPPTAEDCDETSPYICKHYFQAKQVITPHVEPYYDQYAAPYVDIVKPYYEVVNSNVLTPTRIYAVQYGAPYVAKGQDLARSQWETNGQPQLAKLQTLSQEQYDRLVAPYLSKAGIALGPYYDIARTNALQTFHEFLLPSYEFVHPYALQGYEVATGFTTGTALPAVYWTWNKGNAFLDTAVWPQLRVLYVENVEPQLVRIGERLGRYKIKAKTKVLREKSTSSSVASAESTKSSFSEPATQSTISESNTAEQSDTVAATETPKAAQHHSNPVEAPVTGNNESDKRKTAREMVADDLELWQDKFAGQAEEGAAEIEDSVDDIARRMMDTNAKTTGMGLVEQLEMTIKSELEHLKTKISSIAEAEETSPEEAEEAAVASIRKAGVAIKSKAQVIRGWRESYDQELQETVVGAADVHFQILDETRSLALQQIGMKWAWTDGVTYKDWAKYHELKTTFTQWTEELKQLIVTHPALLEAQDASAQVEDEGMTIAAAAARELALLKEAAHWKILARDGTENFEVEAMKLAAETAVQARVEAQAAQEAEEKAAAEAEEIKDAVSDELNDDASIVSDKVDEGVSTASKASKAVDDAASKLTSTFSDASASASDNAEEQLTALSEGVNSVLSEGSKAANEAKDDATDAAKKAFSTASEGAEDMMEEASTVASDATQAIKDSAFDAADYLSTASDSASSIFSDATASVTDESETEETRDSFASEASESLMGDTHTVTDNASNANGYADQDEQEEAEAADDDDAYEAHHATVPDPSEVKSAMFGAAAQSVSDRKPILDDYIDPDTVSGATNAAQEAYSNAASMASDRYSSAVSMVSAQIYGTPKPVHEQLFASVSAAYDDALSAAGAKFNDATEAAASGIRGTPTPTEKPAMVDWEAVESIAAQRLNEGRMWAELQYQSAMIAMGIATPTPTSPTEKYYDQAKMNYFAGLGLAQDRYSSFMAAASSAWSSATATPTPTDLVGSASSLASMAGESASSAAHVVGEGAESAYSAATDSAASAASAVGEGAESAYAAATDSAASAVSAVDESIAAAADAAGEQIYLAGAAVVGTWSDVVSQISAQVYDEPTPIGWFDSMAAEASSQAASATSAAGDAGATASAEASKQYAAVSELVSELLHGREQSFSESVLARLGAVYSTAVASAGSLASEATEAASSAGDKVGEAASQATEVVKETVQQARDEL